MNNDSANLQRFKGGSGMRVMLAETPAQISIDFGETVGLITDGRSSGGTWGMVEGTGAAVYTRGVGEIL